jgi:hypothetical protein
VKRIPDVRALDRLLVPGGVRTIGKKGLRYESGLFWGDDLIPYIGRQVKIRVDMQDAGRVFCFDPQGPAYICEAFDNATSGITIADKIKAKRRADKRVREKAKALKKLAEEAYTDPVAEEMAAAREERAVIRNLPVGDPVDDNPFVDAAMAAAGVMEKEERAQALEQKTVDLELERDPAYSNVVQLARRPAAEAQPEQPTFSNCLARFKWLLEQQRTREITDEELDWAERNSSKWVPWVVTFLGTLPEDMQRWICETFPDFLMTLLFAYMHEQRHRLTTETKKWLAERIGAQSDQIKAQVNKALREGKVTRGDLTLLAEISPDHFREYAVFDAAGNSL